MSPGATNMTATRSMSICMRNAVMRKTVPPYDIPSERSARMPRVRATANAKAAAMMRTTEMQGLKLIHQRDDRVPAETLEARVARTVPARVLRKADELLVVASCVEAHVLVGPEDRDAAPRDGVYDALHHDGRARVCDPLVHGHPGRIAHATKRIARCARTSWTGARHPAHSSRDRTHR